MPDSGKEPGDRRSQKKEAQNVELTPEMEEEPDANSPYDQMIHDERMNIINRLVNELPEKQRLIMQLRDIEGESYKKNCNLAESDRGTSQSESLQSQAKSKTKVFRN